MSNFPGLKWDLINVTVNGTTDTEITYTTPVRSFFLKSRNDTTLYLRKTNNGSNFVTFIPGQTIRSEVLIGDSNWASASIGFIRSDASTDVVEGYVIY